MSWGRVRLGAWGLLLLLAGCVGGAVVRHPGLPGPVSLATLPERRAAFAQAYDLFRRGQNQPALALFEGLAGSYPELADYHLYFAGVINRRLKRTEPAAAAFRQVWLLYPQSVKAAAAALQLGQLLQQAGRLDEARLPLQSALSASDEGTVNAARVGLAEIEEHEGNFAAAYAEFMEVRRQAPGSAAGRVAKQHALALRAQVPALAPTGEARVDDVRLLLREHDAAAAKDAVEGLLAHPELMPASGVETPDLLWLLAEALFGVRDNARAVLVLQNLAERYPDSAAAPRAMFRRATFLWNRNRDAEAQAVFEELLQRYPRFVRASDALYAVGRIQQQAGRAAAAITTFSELPRRYPHSPLVAEARWRIGWIHYQSAHWATAAAEFASLAHQAQSSAAAEGRYWQARSLGHLGRRDAARQLYETIVREEPTSYYAMWAERRLGSASPAAFMTDTTAPPAPAAPPLPAAPFVDPFHLPRSDELRAAGVFDLARGELAAIARAHSEDPAAEGYLLQAYQTVDGYAAAQRLLRRAHDAVRLSAAEHERLLHPLAFWSSVRGGAAAQLLDPLLVEAMIRQESSFDPAARSPAGARGLMQLLPSTAKQLRGADPVNLYDPQVNIELGTRHLRGLLTRFGDDPLKAVAAYNGGETAMERWQRQFADLDPDELVESITYRETREYVKRVVANYRRYVQLYRAPGA